MNRRLSRLFRPLAAALAVSFLLAGCWEDPPPTDGSLLPSVSGDEEPAQEEISLPAAFSLPYQPTETLDPITCPDGMQQVVGALLYEGLFQLDRQFVPQPRLCSAYIYDPATLTYTFQLREGVTFADGSPFTAADAAATLQRARTSVRYGQRLAQVTSVSGSGLTLTVTLASANSGFPALLDIPIVKSGTEGDLIPLGTGPYLFTVDEGGRCLAARDAWWGNSARPVERIGLSIAADRDAMLYQFTSHDVQLVTTDLTGTTPISATGNVSYQDADTTVLHYLGFNTVRAPFNDPALRHALGLGINRGSMVSAFFSGHALDAQFPVSPQSPLYPAALESDYAYDAFAAAMAAVALPSRTLTLLVNQENTFKVSAAEHLAQSFADAGLQVRVEALPWAEYTEALAAGQFDLYYGEVKLTADWDLRPLLASGGRLNYGRWADPETDRLLAAFLSAADREAAMAGLCAHLQRQAPILPLCFKSTSVLYQTGVLEGLTPTAADPFFDLTRWTIHLRDGE